VIVTADGASLMHRRRAVAGALREEGGGKARTAAGTAASVRVGLRPSPQTSLGFRAVAFGGGAGTRSTTTTTKPTRLTRIFGLAVARCSRRRPLAGSIAGTSAASD